MKDTMKEIKSPMRVDDEVRKKLQEKALEFEMTEEPPNAILRKVLGLEHKKAYSRANNTHKQRKSKVNNRGKQRKSRVDNRTKPARRAGGRPATR
jgi:hypothetical protein